MKYGLLLWLTKLIMKFRTIKDLGKISAGIDIFSIHLCCIPFINRNSKTLTEEISNILTKSKQKPIKTKSDRGKEWYNSIFQELLKIRNIHRYSRFTDKGLYFCERAIRSLRNLIKKPVFEKRKADWLSELPSVIKKYNITIHSSRKMTLIQASKKAKEKLGHNNLKDNREIQKPKFQLGQLVRTADIERVYSEGDLINWSYKLYTLTEVIHDTISSYRIDYLHGRYNQNLLLPTKLTR